MKTSAVEHDTFTSNKVYNFKEPLPPPAVEEIYTASEFADPLTDDAKDPEPVVVAKKPRWLVRGDLSSAVAVEDMLQLEQLDEESMLLNLRIRYKANLIYTYVGSILVAVNPYRLLPLYTEKHVKQYDGGVLGPSNSPHIYAIGNEAIASLIKTNADQCVIVSGESGAGKTESIKHLVNYWAKVNATQNSQVTEQVLKATPLLESFGNAKTIRNHNSSRYGKYLEIVYNNGKILGGKLSQYLLEKSRVVYQQYGERNYHIFYQLLAGCTSELKMRLSLKEPHDYNYLSKSYDWMIAGQSEKKSFQTTVDAMTVLEITQKDQIKVFEALAAILHLGNLDFTEQEGVEHLMIDSPATLTALSDCLQIDSFKLISILTTKFITVKGEQVCLPLSVQEALSARDSIARALYSQLFSWLVHKVNKIINPTLHHQKSIAVLDMFGFENFRCNSFEQLCINYANEQIQYLFTRTVYELELERYEKEGLNIDDIQLETNEAMIDLFTLKPLGILRLLDDESQFPKSTDSTFMKNLHNAHEDNELYSKSMKDPLEFTIKHYAGPVTYTSRRFIEKNKDVLRPDVVNLLCSSNNKIIAQVFAEHKESSSTRHLNRVTGRITTLKPKTPTIAAAFQESLSDLMEKINRCNLWFIRCIKPNTSKTQMLFDTEVVSSQISSVGLLDTARIRLLGYPHHMECPEFLNRYEYLYRMEPSDDASAEEFCAQVLKEEFEAASPEDYQIGTTALFLKEAFHQHLEQQRLDVVLKSVRIIEDKVKCGLLRRRFVKQKNAAIKIQAFWKAFYQRQHFLKFKYNVSRLQANLRCRWQRRFYLQNKQHLAAERDIRWAEAQASKELTKQELRNIIGLEIPADLALLYDRADDARSSQYDKNVSQLSAKIYTQNLGLKLPDDINNFIFTHFSETHFHNHLFLAKKEPIDHPFLIKVREKDFKQANTLFQLVLRYMYDLNMTEQQEYILGNYIIQEALKSAVLRDELLVQICVQIWARAQSDVCRRKIGHLLSMAVSSLPPSDMLYKYLLKFASDHPYNGYKAEAQHKLLRAHSPDFPTTRYYPPTVLEWHSARKRAKMALPVVFSKGNFVNCHIDSWTTGEECAKLALCACGLFENRHGWTVQLHDDSGIYEVAGNDCVLDLIGETEIPEGSAANAAPFLVSANKGDNKTHSPAADKNFSNHIHKPDIERAVVVEKYEAPPPTPINDLATNIANIKENLRFVAKARALAASGAEDANGGQVPPPPPVAPPSGSIPIPPPPPPPHARTISELTSKLQHQGRSEADNYKAKQSKLNRRPFDASVPGMSKNSVLNQRYVAAEQNLTTTILSEKYQTRRPGTKPEMEDPHESGGGKTVSLRENLINAKLSNSTLNLGYVSQPAADTTTVAPLTTPSPLSLPAEELSAHDVNTSLTTAETPRFQPPTPLALHSVEPVRITGTTAASHMGSLKRMLLHRVRGYDALTGSDLDEWVDMVFEPIIDNEISTPALNSSEGLKRNLKGNSKPHKQPSSQQIPIEEFSSLQSAQMLKLLIKGSGSDIEVTTDDNDNNNNNNNKITDENRNEGHSSVISHSLSPFSYSNTQIPKQLLHPQSLNNLNAPITPNKSWMRRPRSPLDATPWNMFENVSHAKVKTASSKITNLAGRLIANAKETEEVIEQRIMNSPVADSSVQDASAAEDDNVNRESEADGSHSSDFNQAYSPISDIELSEDELTDAMNANVAFAKNGRPTLAKAPMKRQPSQPSTSALDTWSLGSGSVSSIQEHFMDVYNAREAAPMEKRQELEEVDRNSNGIEFTTHEQVSLSQSNDNSDTESSVTPSEARKPHCLRAQTSISIVSLSDPSIASHSKHASESMPSLQQAVSIDTPKTSCSSNIYHSSPKIDNIRQYTSQGERIIIPTPKALRRKKQTMWDRLLRTLKLVKPAKLTDSPVTVEGKWKKLKYLLLNYLDEQRSGGVEKPTISQLIRPSKSTPNLNSNNNNNDDSESTSYRKPANSITAETSSEAQKTHSKQIYWEQLKPGEPPVKIIIPTPKALRKNKQSRWDRLLSALRVIKPQKPTAPADSAKGKWQKLRYLLNKYVSEQKSKGIANPSIEALMRSSMSIPDLQYGRSPMPTPKRLSADRKAKVEKMLTAGNKLSSSSTNNLAAESKLSKMKRFLRGSDSDLSSRLSTPVHQPSQERKPQTKSNFLGSAPEQKMQAEASRSTEDKKSRMRRLLINYAAEQRETNGDSRGSIENDTGKALVSKEKKARMRQLLIDYAADQKTEANNGSASQQGLTEEKKKRLRQRLFSYAEGQKQFDQQKVNSNASSSKMSREQKQMANNFISRIQKVQRAPQTTEEAVDVLREAKARLLRSRNKATMPHPSHGQREEVKTEAGEVNWLLKAKQRLNKSGLITDLANLPSTSTPDLTAAGSGISDLPHHNNRAVNRPRPLTNRWQSLQSLPENPEPSQRPVAHRMRSLTPTPSSSNIPTPPPIAPLSISNYSRSSIISNPISPGGDEPQTNETISVKDRAKLYFKDLLRVNRSRHDDQYSSTEKILALPSMVTRGKKHVRIEEPEITNEHQGRSSQSLVQSRSSQSKNLSESVSNQRPVTSTPHEDTTPTFTSQKHRPVPFLFKHTEIKSVEKNTQNDVQTAQNGISSNQLNQPAYPPYHHSYWGAPVPFFMPPPYFAMPPAAMTGHPSTWWSNPMQTQSSGSQTSANDQAVTPETQSQAAETEYTVPQRSQPTTPTRSRPVSRASSFVDESRSRTQSNASGRSSAGPGTPRRSKSPARLTKTYSSSSINSNSGRIDHEMESSLPPVVSAEDEETDDVRSSPKIIRNHSAKPSRIPSRSLTSLNRVPSRVGKIIWPPVREEEPKEEIIEYQHLRSRAPRAASSSEVGKLAIEEAPRTKIESGLYRHLLPQRQISAPALSNRESIQKAEPSKTLAERMELLEKKIGLPPSPSNYVVILPISHPENTNTPPELLSPQPSSTASLQNLEEPAQQPVYSSRSSSSEGGMEKPVLQETFTQTSLDARSNKTSVPSVFGALSVDVVPSIVIDAPDYDVSDDDSSTVSETIVPTKGTFQQLASVRSSLYDNSDNMTYLTYTDVPWRLSIRKEVFSPCETLYNVKTIDLIFYQIVRDVCEGVNIRVPEKGREEALHLLGGITPRTMNDPEIPAELKWTLIQKARSWPFYFARIHAVVGDGSDIQLVAVSHSGVWFGKKEKSPDGKIELIPLKHIIYEDISSIQMPREGTLHITAAYVLYKVYSPKAGALMSIINAYGIEDHEDGYYVQAVKDHITCEPGYLSFKKGDMIKVKPEKMTYTSNVYPAPSAGWLYGSFSGKSGSFPEDTIKTLSKKDINRQGSFSDTRSRHSSGRSDGDISPTLSGKYSMLEFSMMYFRENLDRYITKPAETGLNNIKTIESMKLSALKRKKSFKTSKEDKLQRQESWSWKEQADMIKWNKDVIPASLLKLPTEAMNKIAIECFEAVMQFMGDLPLSSGKTTLDCAFVVLKACHQCPELRDEVYCQLTKQTTTNKSPNSQSCLKGWRLLTLVAAWFSPSEILKPYLINYLQQNASDPSRPYHSPAQNCLQMLRKTMKYGGRRNVPSAEEISAIADGKLTRRQQVLLPGGVSYAININPSTVVQDAIYDMCTKLGVVSQMEQDEYTVFALVENDNEFARLKREEYIMDVVTELRLQRKECTLMFERTSWFFPIRLETASYDLIDMMYAQCVPDYIDGHLLTLDPRAPIPAKQLDDIVTIAALFYRAAGNDREPESVKDIDRFLPGQILSLGLLKHSQYLNGVRSKLKRLVNHTDVDCKIEMLNMLRKWPLFGASFFKVQCLTDPRMTGDCLLAVNRAGVHFLHHKTHRVILSYPYTEVISSRKIASDKLDEQFLDIKVGNNRLQKVLRVQTINGSDIAYLIGQYIKAVNSSAKLSV